MTDRLADTSDIERVRRAIGRGGFAIAVASLLLGAAMYLFELPASTRIFQFAFGVLILMPAKNVVAVLADEVRRRDWWFVLLAAAVLAELAFGTWDRVR